MNKLAKNVMKKLENVKSFKVTFPPFFSSIKSQNKPFEEVKTFIICNELNFPENKLTYDVAVSNVTLWLQRGYNIEFYS